MKHTLSCSSHQLAQFICRCSVISGDLSEPSQSFGSDKAKKGMKVFAHCRLCSGSQIPVGQLVSAMMQAFGNNLCTERRNQTVGWDGETERENERVQISICQTTDKVQLSTAVCVTTQSLCFSQSNILRTCTFMATVDVIDLISSQRCIFKCDL